MSDVQTSGPVGALRSLNLTAHDGDDLARAIEGQFGGIKAYFADTEPGSTLFRGIDYVVDPSKDAWQLFGFAQVDNTEGVPIWTIEAHVRPTTVPEMTGPDNSLVGVPGWEVSIHFKRI